MENKQFNVSDALRWTCTTMYTKASFFLAVGAIFFVLSLVNLLLSARTSPVLMNYIIQGQAVAGIQIVMSVCQFLLVFIVLCLMLGFIRIMLDIYDYGSAELSTLFSQGYLILRVLCGRLALVLLAALIAFVTFLPFFFLFDWSPLFVVGLCIEFTILLIYFFCRYFFYETVLIDQDLGIIAGLKESARLTNGARWKILTFFMFFSVCSLSIALLSMLPMHLMGFQAIAHSVLLQFAFIKLTFLQLIMTFILNWVLASVAVYAYRKQQEQAGKEITIEHHM